MNASNLMEVNTSFMSSTKIIWDSMMMYLPKIAFAILILVIGLILASLLGKLVTRIVRSLKVDKILTTMGLSNKLKESNINITISGVLGWIVKWFIIVAVLLTISGMLELTTVSVFLTEVLLYIPNVIVAVVILTIGLIMGNFISELVGKSIATSDFVSGSSVKVLRTVTKWIIIFFAVIAALAQLNIGEQLVQILFAGIVAMFSLAGGIAFGFGGKERAKELLDNVLDKK